MKTARYLVAACSLMITQGALADGPNNLLFNPSFEQLNASNMSLPEGWAFFNTGRLRTIGDGLSPAAQVRTGNNAIEFPSGADFVGATTDVFNPSTLTFFNPPYVWQGGDVTVSGWYLIPSDSPLTGANAGIKLEFRRENSSIATAFEDLSITGTTNDQWVEFSMTITDQQMMDAAGAFPPFPVSVSVLPLRFGDANSTGTIFWDDLCIVQGAPCLPDVNGDGNLSPADFTAWIAAFNANDPAADQNQDGSITPADFTAWISNFNTGCG